MKFNGLFALTALCCVSTAYAADEKWTDLFNGKDLAGWTQKGGKAQYTVEDGVIIGRTVADTPNSFLCTTKDYGDFAVELEFKCDPRLNSGVQVRSQCFDKDTELKDAKGAPLKDGKGKVLKAAAGRVHGYQNEIDVDDKKARWWTAGIYEEGTRGWLFPGAKGGDAKAFTAQGDKLNKAGDWNKLRIECKGDSIKTWLNGELRADLKDDRVAKGFIGLQVHGVGKDKTHEGWEVRFRNIRIQELGQ
ncbi:MAG: DUF1080 domain-containing protein [Kiritimatiellaeota bacterium]|nr:DUF1080 domain-containing protein [Kiritimatiellota bacterium]